MPRVTEVAPDVYQITVLMPEINLQFSHFLVKDEQPLLFHTGMRRMFPLLKEGVEQVLDPRKIRWISFSHFESDECGALNDWLALAPQAETVCSPVGAYVNLQDFAIRPPRGLTPAESLETGKYRFRYHPTAHVPHGWDAGVLFEETQRTLFCSDLFHHDENVEPVTTHSVLDRVAAALTRIQAGPLADYMPYTSKTGLILRALAELKPRTLALNHGSTYIGDGAGALQELDVVMREKLGDGTRQAA